MKRKSIELGQFGQNIRQARKRLGLSQEQLADRCGLHRTYVGDVERGARNLGLLNVIRIARAIGTLPGKLLEGIR
jgi:transcriptional regulator with XRE-family HTH domain